MKEGGSMADNFEKNWKEALNKIEINPNPIVWENIDRSLANADLVYYRKKAKVYKWAAIAAIVFAISVTIPNYLGKNKGSIADQTFSTLQPANSTLINDRTAQILPVNINTGNIQTAEKQQKNDRGTLLNRQQLLLDVSESDQTAETSKLDLIAFSNLSKYNAELSHSLFTEDVPDVHIYKKADYSVLNQKRKTGTKEAKKYWAGVGVGSSTFDPNYQLNQPNDVIGAVLRSQPNFVSNTPEVKGQNTTFQDQITQGVNYQVGMNLGVMMGKRVSLESGFSYAEAQLTSQTDLIVDNKIFAKAVAMTSEVVSLQQVSQITSTQDIVEYERDEISLDNTFQFASFPLKAGYLILNKKVQVKLNAGLITNIYMGNTLTDHTNQVASLELFPGSSSPYRTVSFSGMTGISLGYNLFNQFDVMVEPNFSQALQPLTKDDSNFNATPNGFGMMAGLRYRFGN